MKILLIASLFNSLTQRIFCECRDAGHKVSVVLATSDNAMLDEVQRFVPEIIIAPYLTKFIPATIYENFPTFIVHPGIIGDRGPHSLDHAVLEQKREWGVTLIKANGEIDGGDVYGEVNFSVRDGSKGSLYRRELSAAASQAIKNLLERFQNNTLISKPQRNTPLHVLLSQSKRAIDWQNDSTDSIIRKINAADGYPGVLDIFFDKELYLFGATKEAFVLTSMQEAALHVKIKDIFAKRDGAICIKTKDGAVWVSHLKEKGLFKLPATYVLKSAIQGIKEQRIPLMMEAQRNGFEEIRLEIKGEVAYLYFNFYNGAFSAQQAIRLKYAIESLEERCKVLVLMGGDDFFSNGINLNILEDSKKQGEDGWSSINAMNDLVRMVLLSDAFLTVAALRGNAGAGGVFLALACDYVVAREGIVLNPHYKTIGLSGSEFHTYTLPKRVGKIKAKELLEEAFPFSAVEAKRIDMIDELFSGEDKHFQKELESFTQTLVIDEDEWYNVLDEKRERVEEDAELIHELHQKELAVMYPEFWEESSPFHKLRREFVYKVCPISTPKRLQYHA